MASEFINAYDFESAFQTLSRISTPSDNILSIILHTNIAANRLAFNNRKRWHIHLNDGTKLQAIAEQYIRGKVPNGFLNYPELASSKTELFEFASICQHYFLTQNYTLGVGSISTICLKWQPFRHIAFPSPVPALAFFDATPRVPALRHRPRSLGFRFRVRG